MCLRAPKYHPCPIYATVKSAGMSIYTILRHKNVPYMPSKYDFQKMLCMMSHIYDNDIAKLELIKLVRFRLSFSLWP